MSRADQRERSVNAKLQRVVFSPGVCRKATKNMCGGRAGEFLAWRTVHTRAWVFGRAINVVPMTISIPASGSCTRASTASELVGVPVDGAL